MIPIPELAAVVRTWARDRHPDAYNYRSPATYWRLAADAGVISGDDYDRARTYYGDRFDWTGD